MSERPFARHYYIDLEADYPDIYRDDHLYATWSRMLNIAEHAWPVVPEVPRSAKGAYVKTLMDRGLVIAVKPFGYRIKGLDAERNARSNAASIAARTRWGNANGHADAMPRGRNQPKTNTRTKGSTAELSLESDEPTPDDWRSLTAVVEPR
jgi:hypothetical protein